MWVGPIKSGQVRFSCGQEPSDTKLDSLNFCHSVLRRVHCLFAPPPLTATPAPFPRPPFQSSAASNLSPPRVSSRVSARLRRDPGAFIYRHQTRELSIVIVDGLNEVRRGKVRLIRKVCPVAGSLLARNSLGCWPRSGPRKTVTPAHN